MARQRKFQPTPIIRSEITHQIRQGYSDSRILADVRNRWPNANVNSLRSMIRDRRDNIARMQRINQTPLTQPVNLGRSAGCQPGQRIAIRFSVSWSDPDNPRLTREFGHTVIMSPQTSSYEWGAILAGGAEAVRRQSLRRRGQSPKVPPADQLANDPNYEIKVTSMECI